jgi:hypothetical protein
VLDPMPRYRASSGRAPIKSSTKMMSRRVPKDMCCLLYLLSPSKRRPFMFDLPFAFMEHHEVLVAVHG